MQVLGNPLNWDPVAWLSLLMVGLAIGIIVFLAFKVRMLMNKDASAHEQRE